MNKRIVQYIKIIMKPFTLTSKVTKKGKVKVCLSSEDGSFPIHLMKYPNLHTKKYYTIHTIDTMEKENEIPYKYKEIIIEVIEQFKRDLRLVSIHVENEKHMETFIKSPDTHKVRSRYSCDFFIL